MHIQLRHCYITVKPGEIANPQSIEVRYRKGDTRGENNNMQ